MVKQFTEEDDALLAELGVEIETKKAPSRTPREERIIAGFEEIQRFFEEHGRTPQHGEDCDIFERLYATRLDRIRELEECRSLVQPLDHQGLLDNSDGSASPELDALDDEALLAELGVELETVDITELKHVRSSAEKRAAEEVANREPCKDFDKFKPLFEQVQQELNDKIRESRPFKRDTDILPGQFFILGGQKAYVHSVGKEFLTPEGRTNRRMRVIFDNGVEANALMRSFQRALYKKENTGRRITEPSAGPLFGNTASEDDQESGTIYVLRSQSDHPVVAENREVLHKIGVTGGKVERRIANAKLDPTFLMADVEIVATYELYNINRIKLEGLFHRFFATARLDLEIPDRFGRKVRPQEWYLVPLSVIDDVVKAIQNNSIDRIRYSRETASLIADEQN
ncbi:MAG: GIY-YIG nuclease family protein [Alphaproteobacteria bacterium]|nr:GIY-YIG nuclease family protein [Alphaproteobacteria bacterium]